MFISGCASADPQRNPQPVAFDGIADPVAAKSLQALDLMEDRLQGGRKWTRHFMFRDGGKMCLLGASYFGCNIGAESEADRALEYLARAITPGSRAKDWSHRCWVETTIADFNDNCAGYCEIERVLRAAQELARADIRGQSVGRQLSNAKSERKWTPLIRTRSFVTFGSMDAVAGWPLGSAFSPTKYVLLSAAHV
jgi:hypothetical protein